MYIDSYKAINIVKNGVLNSYPSKTVGQAFSGFMSNPKWEALIADDGNTYVNVTGGILYNGKLATALVQYRIYMDDNRFEIQAFEIDDEPQTMLMYGDLIVKAFEQETISVVKNGSLNGYPNQTLGWALEGFLTDIEWGAIMSLDGNVYVNVTGGLLYGGHPATAVVQYMVDTVELTFLYNAFEIDGVGQELSVYLELIELAFG